MLFCYIAVLSVWYLVMSSLEMTFRYVQRSLDFIHHVIVWFTLKILNRSGSNDITRKCVILLYHQCLMLIIMLYHFAAYNVTINILNKWIIHDCQFQTLMNFVECLFLTLILQNFSDIQNNVYLIGWYDEIFTLGGQVSLSITSRHD